jgi:hypothetical protein
VLLLALTIASTVAAVVSALSGLGLLPQRHRPQPQPQYVLVLIDSIEALMVEPGLEDLIEGPPSENGLPEAS